MTTYWVLGKGVSANQMMSPMGGVPSDHSPSLNRQTSHHSSLAAVVFGMMQATKRSANINTTRKFVATFHIKLNRTQKKIILENKR